MLPLAHPPHTVSEAWVPREDVRQLAAAAQQLVHCLTWTDAEKEEQRRKPGPEWTGYTWIRRYVKHLCARFWLVFANLHTAPRDTSLGREYLVSATVTPSLSLS